MIDDFEFVLKNIQKGLNNHNFSRQELLKNCINNRLNKCYETYNKELNLNIQSLLNYKDTTLLQRL